MFSTTSNATVDKALISLIVIYHFFACLYGLAAVLLLGSGEIVLLFLVLGVASALFLNSRALPARVTALLWHGVVVVLIIERKTKGSEWIKLLSALSFLYLVATSLPRAAALWRRERPEGIP